MTDTEENQKLKPLGPWARKAIAIAWLTAKLFAVLTPVGAALWTVYKDAAARAQSAKQLAEDGYQVQRHAVEALQERVRVLEAAAKQIQAAAPPPPRSRRRPLPPAPTVKVTAAKPLPANLDQAKAAVSPPAPPQPSGTGKDGP